MRRYAKTGSGVHVPNGYFRVKRTKTEDGNNTQEKTTRWMGSGGLPPRRFFIHWHLRLAILVPSLPGLSISEMEISALTDDELLTVLSFLSSTELLRCRAVCLRWASLARHPTLWRNRRMEYYAYEFYAAVLRFAPCLDYLSVDLETDANDRFCTILSTSCAVSRVRIYFSVPDAVYAAQIISRQAHLGRLKAVELYMIECVDRLTTSSSLESSLCALILQLSHTRGLEEIDLDLFDNAVSAECARRLATLATPWPVSLKRLALKAPFEPCRLLLQWNTDTLETVSILGTTCARTTSLLSCMPRLRELKCNPLEGMRALLNCPSLNTLHLHVGAHLLSEACAYVRAAAGKQLEHLTLTNKLGEAPECGELLLCLEGPGTTPAALRSLRLGSVDAESRLLQLHLPRVLPRLPLLTVLDLDDEPTPALLQALDGRAVPQLQQFLVCLPPSSYSLGCAHQFIHAEGVRDLMRKYPRLHVVMKHVWVAQGCECASCKEACHAVPKYAWSVLFSHEAGARCGVPHKYDFDGVAFQIRTTTASTREQMPTYE